MRRIIVAAGMVAGLLGITAPAMATTTTPHSNVRLGQPSNGINYIRDETGGGGPDAWMNDSAYGCTDSTPVLGWMDDTGTENEQVYFINQGSGRYNIHFESCGNNWCIWQYGFGSSPNNLYMHTCNGSADNDLYYISDYGNGEFGILNVDNTAAITGHVDNEQLTSQPFTGNWSTWVASSE